MIGRIVGGESIDGVAADYGLDKPSMLAYWAALMDLLNEEAAKHGGAKRRSKSIKESKKTSPLAPSASGAPGDQA
jgi:hypothetical protein